MSTPDSGTGSAITAVLLRITEHAERLAALDQREASHIEHLTRQLGELARSLSQTRDELAAVVTATGRHTAILEALDGLDQHVAALATRVTQIVGSGTQAGDHAYQPGRAPRWWALDGEERSEALARLRAWVEQVYQPGYGHLAAALGTCWEQHPLCLYGLDWLMELWSAFYLTEDRQLDTVASQAEWQSRLLPALAAQMHAETSRCKQGQSLNDRPLRLSGHAALAAGQPPAARG